MRVVTTRVQDREGAGMSVVAAAEAAVEAARAAFADADALTGLGEQELVDLLAVTGELARVVGGQQVRLAGEVAGRSAGPDAESFCKRLGGARPRDAVATAFGLRAGQARELLELSQLTTPMVSLTGEPIAPKYPTVAGALDAGEVSVGQARAIVSTLEPAAPRADLEQLTRAEGWLVHSATDPEAPLVPELLVEQARAFAAVLDPDGVLPNSQRQRDARGVRSSLLPDGTKRYVIIAPPIEAGELDAALDAFSSPRVRFVDTNADDRGADGDAETGEVVDDRTRPQKQFDGLLSMVRAQVAAGNTPTAGGEVPRLVLTGTIEAFDAYMRGIDHPDRTLTVEHTRGLVPIEAVDRILCDGIVQRAIVDTNGHVLNLGREQRLFSQAQRRALAAHDKGCATPACRVPVSGTEAHHVTAWQHGGPTDTDNGILLCSHCHHEVHAGRLRIIGSPGNWRVVANLRAAYRYARNPRTGQAHRPAAATSTTPGVTPTATLDAMPASTAPMAPSPTPTGAAELLDRRPDRTSAHSAAPTAVRLPDPPTPTTAVVTTTSPPAVTSVIEHRLRQRLTSNRRLGRRRPPIDHGPPPRVILRR